MINLKHLAANHLFTTLLFDEIPTGNSLLKPLMHSLAHADYLAAATCLNDPSLPHSPFIKSLKSIFSTRPIWKLIQDGVSPNTIKGDAKKCLPQLISMGIIIKSEVSGTTRYYLAGPYTKPNTYTSSTTIRAAISITNNLKDKGLKFPRRVVLRYYYPIDLHIRVMKRIFSGQAIPEAGDIVQYSLLTGVSPYIALRILTYHGAGLESALKVNSAVTVV